MKVIDRETWQTKSTGIKPSVLILWVQAALLTTALAGVVAAYWLIYEIS